MMHGKDVRLTDVSISFNEFIAVHPTSLHIEAGEFFSILGPSGCGKTTLLRAISGFTELSEGQIFIGDAPMQGVGPHERPTALIFQNLALFPLMKIWENVSFGLEMRKMPKAKAKERAMELLDMVALTEHADKLPTEISGGQKQRVAIARALAVDPAVLLLDEPLSALDLKLRQHMRTELKEIQRKTGVTFIYITHDQGEALTMSDRVAVMKSGIVQQIGNADEIYSNPTTPFVASFVGENNLLTGTVRDVTDDLAIFESNQGLLKVANKRNLKKGQAAMLFVRPEKMSIINANSEVDNKFPAAFVRRDLEGPFINVFFQGNGKEFVVHLTNSGEAGHDLPSAPYLSFSAEDGLLLPEGELADE